MMGKVTLGATPEKPGATQQQSKRSWRHRHRPQQSANPLPPAAAPQQRPSNPLDAPGTSGDTFTVHNPLFFSSDTPTAHPGDDNVLIDVRRLTPVQKSREARLELWSPVHGFYAMPTTPASEQLRRLGSLPGLPSAVGQQAVVFERMPARTDACAMAVSPALFSYAAPQSAKHFSFSRYLLGGVLAGLLLAGAWAAALVATDLDQLFSDWTKLDVWQAQLVLGFGVGVPLFAVSTLTAWGVGRCAKKQAVEDALAIAAQNTGTSEQVSSVLAGRLQIEVDVDVDVDGTPIGASFKPPAAGDDGAAAETPPAQQSARRVLGFPA